MKKVLLATSIFLTLCSVSFSNAAVCPDINLIKSIGLLKVSEYGLGNYAAFTPEFYEAEFKWNFILGIFEAEDKTKALEKGKQLLKRVSGSPDPYYKPSEQIWICDYTAFDDLVAMAEGQTFVTTN
jgi:hypothetical protein